VGQAISEVLPFAVGVAVSPIPLVAVILMLFTPRARVNGPAFLVGWVVGLSLVVAVVYVVLDALDASGSDSASDGTSTVKLVLGAALLLGGIRRWSRQPAADAEVEMPKWMAAVDAFTPVKALGLGVLLSSVNPKNLVLALGAASGVAQLGVSTGDAVVGLTVFVVVASSTTAALVGYRLLGGDRSEARLDEWKAWLTAHDEAVMAVLFLVFGVVLVSEGLRGLTA
jgi:threonine/homoserine/homoserine lactone efflux protein